MFARDELDLLQFHTLARRADRAMHEGDHRSVSRDANAAIRFWRGHPLAGLDVGPELAGRQFVVVLDDASSASQVRDLLPGSGSFTLVTSRHSLTQLGADDHFTLDVVDPSSGLAILARHVGFDRVEAEAEAAHDIVVACSGHPLAIRVAGAQLNARPTHSLRDLADRLLDEEHRLDELAVGQLSVRDSVVASYRGLSPAGRLFLRRLGALPDDHLTAGAAARRLDLPEACEIPLRWGA
ncbi:transcriptional activator domain-containing protein [Asanoa hainanensis]|uniref:Transcriptional activator domain-containing protein n=1 Tax=Asanoa hainanensis TaxID=560556 RepID=A0A239PHK3_9ACTN|nr:BTAD domain-containing putative transcriptional regulator [Asanoa hainanensis]SNT66275.1 transcriptional activator domain-containing protein [Asanoa hainanensis]